MPIDPKQLETFLHYISQLESSGGKNVNHPVVETGPQAGEQAVGSYGMMPNTKQEFMNRYPAQLDENSSDNDVARKVGEYVLNKAKGNETTAAGLWNMGHNLPEDRMDEAHDSDYAQKYEALRKQVPEALDLHPYYDEDLNEDKFDKLKKVLGK